MDSWRWQALYDRLRARGESMSWELRWWCAEYEKLEHRGAHVHADDRPLDPANKPPMWGLHQTAGDPDCLVPSGGGKWTFCGRMVVAPTEGGVQGSPGGFIIGHSGPLMDGARVCEKCARWSLEIAEIVTSPDPRKAHP